MIYGHTMLLKSATVVFVLAAFVLCCGCGGPSDIGLVEGVVTLDGQPLADAAVEFQPEAGRPSDAMTDEAGHYELRYTADQMGAALGKHTVRITAGGQRMDANDQLVDVPETVPAKYNSKSELTVEVVAGKNTHDFPLMTK